ncbi:MBL fold metallo-hydrolase [Streptomyces sp. NPDC048650]|uniref:MBL fold metallo-hydrolase n=1 Tax=unclassified Streptomyces TaxID=2593676 RepID=UPI0037125FBD
MDQVGDRQRGELAVAGACCRALAATPARLLRPRRPDRRLLSRLVDAGVPRADRTVRLTSLAQGGQRAPRAVVAEGVWRPLTVDLGMTSFLVEHPRARILIDPAMCADVHSRVLRHMPTALRVLVSPGRPITGMPAALDSVGLTPADIDLALPTHLHWDHVSGLLELPPDLAVATSRAERDFALADVAPLGIVTGPLRDRSFTDVDLEDRPVLTFPRSHDLFGDGSVVLVGLPGHTPGSVGVLLALEGGRSVLLAGDAAWHTAQIVHLREKAPLPGQLVDADRDAAFATLHRLHALPDSVTVIPTHDRTAAAEFRP